LDGMKGISILWIVVFHFFGAYAAGAYPSSWRLGYFRSFLLQCAPSSWVETVGCVLQALVIGVVQLGFHAVAVFLVLSGFGLTYALAKTGEPPQGWAGWYRRRALRLFPMYWVAHLIYLVSPFVARPERIDYRFVLSLLGDRIYPIYTIFYYVNPAWWYFGLLLQLYLVFPLLYRLLQKLGLSWFLVFCGLFTVGSRYLLLCVVGAHGYYVQGAFFGARLWEFAAGMALGLLCGQDAAALQRRVLSGTALALGILLYALGVCSYEGLLSYTLTDGLIGSGLFLILARVARWSEALPRLGKLLAYVGAYSYGLYLVHQPYVLYLGERVRDLSGPVFALVACGVVALLAAGVIPLERAVNQLVDRLLDGRKARATPAPRVA
jgi:peptidoglycan/LPS O-acetylase OafA/YrhL